MLVALILKPSQLLTLSLLLQSGLPLTLRAIPLPAAFYHILFPATFALVSIADFAGIGI